MTPRTKGEIQKGAFITEGAVVSHRIGYDAAQRGIPDDETAICALTGGARTRIFGLTRGRRSHLFFYNTWTIDNFVWLVKPVAANTVGGELVCATNGVMYGIAFVEEGGRYSNVMFRYDPSSFLIGMEMWSVPGDYEEIPCPLGDNRISRLVRDVSTDTVYGIFTDTNVFFSWEIESGEVSEHGCLGSGKVSKALCIDDLGRVWCVGPWGDVFRYDPGNGGLCRTDMVVPSGKGKEYVNQATAMVFDPASAAVYGGTLTDGLLFSFGVEDETMTCLGKPIDQRHIRCLAVVPDGRLYGIAGEPGTGMCHLFIYNPGEGGLRDLGLVTSALSETWVAHEIDTMCVDVNGHLVMGENDRMSHVFAYYPPINR